MDPSTPRPGRRSFLNWLLGGSMSALAAAVVYPVARFLSPPEVPEATTQQVEAGLVNDPELVEKGFKIVRFGQEPVILIQVDDEYRAFAATCTHLDCIVEYRRQEQPVLWCNCHDGQFDLSGRNVAGPPPRPLTPYRVDVVASESGPGTLVVSKV